MKKSILLAAALFGLFSAGASAAIVDFEELTQFTDFSTHGGGQYYNGNEGTGNNSSGWTSGGVFFNNSYDETSFPPFTFWNGWAYSNVVNITSPEFTNQYAAYPGGGAAVGGEAVPGGKYAVAGGGGAYFDLPNGTLLGSVQLANTTYAALVLRDGNPYANPFGDDAEADLFRVTLTGYDAAGRAGNILGAVDVELAYDRVFDNVADFILDDWLTVDLTPISAARSVGLTFYTTDSGDFGANTPLYVAMDNLTFAAVPEPSSFAAVALAAAGLLARRRRSLKLARDASRDDAN